MVAIGTLKQNNRMIESTTRPYIGIAGDLVNNGNPVFSLRITNFGSSAGTINSIESNVDLHGYALGRLDECPFQNIDGCTLLPRQSLLCAIDYHRLRGEGIDVLSFTLSYSSGERYYSEVYDVGILVNAALTHARISTEGKELETISYTLQGMVERMY